MPRLSAEARAVPTLVEKIGMPEQIGIVKGNIERVSQQISQQNSQLINRMK